MLTEENAPRTATVLAGTQSGEPVMRNAAAKRNAARTTDDITSVNEHLPAGLAQRRRALEKANAVRSTRATVKRQLRSGELDFDMLLDDLPPACAEMPVIKLVLWCPNIGEDRARRILKGLVHTDTLRVSSLSLITKRKIAERVYRYVGPYLEAQASAA